MKTNVQAIFNQIQADPSFPKTQIFVGPAESGKTSFANKLAEGKNHALIDGKKYRPYHKYAFQDISQETELIIIDNVPFKKLQAVLCSLMHSEIYVNRKREFQFKMTRPHTIITCDCDDFDLERHGASFTRRFELLRFPQTDNQP